MKRIAPELDCLMWTLVEENNPRAVEEFVRRYPGLAKELERRGKIVNGLKELRPRSELQLAPPPPFRLRSERRPTVSRGTMVAVGAMVLAALGLGSFTVSYFFMAEPPPKATTPVVTPRPENRIEPFEAPAKQPPPIANDRPETSEPNQGVEEPPIPAALISVNVSEAPLSVVLQVIGVQAKKEIIPAPGLKVDEAVSAKYEGQPAMDILQDMGKRYGFKAFDQGDGTIIVVPAEEDDNEAAQPNPNRPSRRISG